MTVKKTAKKRIIKPEKVIDFPEVDTDTPDNAKTPPPGNSQPTPKMGDIASKQAEVSTLQTLLKEVAQMSLDFVNERHRIGGPISTFEKDSFGVQLQFRLDTYNQRYGKQAQGNPGLPR